MTRRSAALAFVVVLAIIAGALREFIFINLNYQLDFLANHRAVSYAHSMFQGWVRGMGLGQLVVLKWVMAALFTGLMLGLGLLLSRLLFGHHRNTLPLIVAYVAIGLLALFFHALSAGDDGWHVISVKLLHALQYPVVLVFIWGAHRLVKHRP
jgi:hypothetical protein